MANALDLLEKQGESYVPRLTKGQRILFVGRSGSGKSNALTSFPGPLYEFDCDNRFRGAVTSVNWLGIDKFKQIDFDFYNPKDGFEAIDNKLNEIANAAEKKQCKYLTVGIESVGTLIYMLALDSQKKRGIKGEGYMKGKVRGKVEFLHPDDYNYVSTALRLLMYNYIFPLNEMGINVLCSAWVADKWGRKPGAKDYDPPEVIGEKILGPGNAVEEFMGYFDEMYYFYKDPPFPGQLGPKYMVEFNGNFAKTAYGLPAGKFEVTNKSFFDLWSEKIRSLMLQAPSSQSPSTTNPIQK